MILMVNNTLFKLLEDDFQDSLYMQCQQTKRYRQVNLKLV